jgi:hypothetical protein
MADDSMEISSEHGHDGGDGGDGDIDIDFDFTTAQVDEDYVLEDAALNADFGDTFHPQSSPATGNDDLMIDEDVDSYPMDDADLLHDENGHTMEHEVVPFATKNSLHFGENQTDRDQFEADDPTAVADYTYVHQGSSEPQAVQKDVSQENSRDSPHQEGLNSAEVMAVPDAEKSSTDPAHHDSPIASPFQGSPHSAVSARGPRSPPASNPEHGIISPDHKSNNPETTLTSPSLSGDASKVEEITSSDGRSILPPPRDVIVVYRSVEYALFSSSELDDPESFFLSDISIAEKPLADLFKAVRQVIQEDLTNEDELCMAVEDLGIETEEVSCTQTHLMYSRLRPFQRSSTLLHDISLTKILTLREKLLRNDGVESFRPMYIILGTRTNFSKRLESLIAGAAEGKGLSELVPWDEHSESPDDLGEADESKNDVESTLGSQGVENVPGVEEDGDQAAHAIENSQPEDAAAELEQEPNPESADDTKLSTNGSASASGNGFVQDYTAVDTNLSSLQTGKQNRNPSNEEYDKDDLIDYSEEEGDNIPTEQRHVKSNPTDESRTIHGTYNFFPPCLKPNACFCSKCNVLLLAEYEAINEDLRRRSTSRTTEDRVFEQSNEQAPAPTEDNYEEQYVEENDIEYEEKNEHQEEFENGDFNTVHETFITGAFDAAGSLEQYDAGLLADEFGGEGEFAEEGAMGDSYDVFGTEAQEYHYGDEDSLEDDTGDRHSLQRDEPGLGNSQNLISGTRNSPPEAELIEDNLEQADTAESSVTVAADEIQYEDEAEEEIFNNSEIAAGSQALNDEMGHSVGVGVEHEDEIDYEDDEDEDGKEQDPGTKTPLTAASVFPTSSGKRSRADIESDDAMSMSSKGAYLRLLPKRRRTN